MIGIYGSGGQGKVILDIIQQDRKCRKCKKCQASDYSTICFVDDRAELCKYINGKVVISPKAMTDVDELYIAIGDNAQRKIIYEKMTRAGYSLPALIHPKAYVADDAAIGDGTVICVNAIVQTGARIGEACIVNTGAQIDHDCKIGDFVHVAPNATLCGGVKIGAKSLIGAGAVIAPDIEIGQNCLITIGTKIYKNIPDNSIVNANGMIKKRR